MWRTCSNIRIKQNFKIVAGNYISPEFDQKNWKYPSILSIYKKAKASYNCLAASSDRNFRFIQSNTARLAKVFVK